MNAMVMSQAGSEEQAAPAFEKRNFLKLPVQIDVDALLEDYRSIPRDAWATSHWNIHCSADMLLLRGGTKGTAEDFTTRQVSNKEILGRLPYISWLLSEDGPFGLPTYAFLFRMKPMGVARPHHDNDPAWYDPVRIHVPITTNDGAFLMAEKHVKHLAVGEVWTFDNQSFHSVVNGDGVRTHLIFDVLPNPKVNRLLEQAEWDPGIEDEERWARAFLPEAPPVLSPAAAEPLSVAEKVKLGLNPDGFASRVTKRNAVSRLTFAPIREGDVIISVNGVDECAVARTAIDYIQVRHKAGEAVALDIIRNGEHRDLRLRLYRNPMPKGLRRARHMLLGLLRRRYE
ncbi:MAG: aspartyl/asparaginyl beta-hydroxylase domain-containing protein [Kiloniellales bacterium]